MDPTNLALLAVAAVAALWPQIGRLLGLGGRKDGIPDVEKIVAEVLKLLQGGGVLPLVPDDIRPPAPLNKAEAMSRLLAVEADLRRAGFSAAADKAAEAAASLLTPTVPA